MSVLKIKNEQGIWESVPAIKGEDGKDGAIQYTAGTNIEITPENVINCTIKNTSELTNDSDFTTKEYVDQQIGNALKGSY